MRLLALLSLCLALAGAGLHATPADAADANVKKKKAPRVHVVLKKRAVKSRLVHKAPAEDLDNLRLQSSAVLVQDASSGAVLFEKNANAVVPIASITKLMTAMVVLDATPNMGEMLTVDDADVDMLRGSRSRLRVGTALSREDMLRLALMSSENRAASALARYYPGGTPAFVEAMNKKAVAIGLNDTRFHDSTGLNSGNVSSARDLVKMVAAASKYPVIRELSTTPEYMIDLNGRQTAFRNTNVLVRNSSWDIGLSKTGFINESGKCLVMQAWLANKPVIIVLLDSWGKLTRIGDAQRIRRWVEHAQLLAGKAG